MESQALDRYFSNLSENSKINAGKVWRFFMDYVAEAEGPFQRMDIDGLVQYQRDNPGSYEVLDLAQAWVSSLTRLRANTKKTYLGRVRGLFLMNRAELPRDPGYKIKSDVPRARARLWKVGFQARV